MKAAWSLTFGACLFAAAAPAWTAEEATKSPLKREVIPPPRDLASVTAAIDRAIDRGLAQEKIPASPAAADAEFLRRIYLDLTGRIPTAEQAAAFLNSTDPQKRSKLIDDLLARPTYGEHFGIVWSDLIVKRDPNNRGVNTDAFKKWLAASFNEDRGWDRIVRDMLVAEGTVEQNPASTFYVAHRDMNALVQSKVVGTAANLFMGVQLQCAECHNQPFIRDWKQTDFWGVAAFFSQTRSSGGRVGNNNTPIAISEGDAPAAGRRPGFGPTRQVLSGGRIEIPDATDARRRTGKVVKAKFFQGEEPALAEKGPYRPVFADWLVSPKNRFFAPAAVNRLWAHFFARGFVNPLDDMQDDNQPSHPELLALLADELRASGFDQKHLIRVICNSKAYQRSSKALKENEQDSQLFSHQAVKVMSPEVLYDSLCLALGTTDLGAPAGGRPGFGGGRGGPATPRAAFVNFFSTKEEGGDPTEMGFGVPQFLRLMNSQPFNKGGAIIDRIVKEGLSPDKALETLYLTTLSRRPTEAEVKKLTAYIARKKEPKDGYAGVLWILVNSAEFVCVR